MSETLLSVRGLSVSIGDTTVLDGVSFDLAKGAITGLFGVSGSGKTTVLHAICGLLDTRYRVEGRVELDGRLISKATADERSRLGMSIVLQDLGLFEDRSVAENVAYPLRRRRVSQTLIVKQVRDTLEQLRIADLADRLPNQISGGQRQRVALARALVYRPSLLVLDEPLRGIQESMRLRFLALIHMISKSGTTILLVTHERAEIDLIAETVLTIDGGKLRRIESRSHAGFRSLAPDVAIAGEDGDILVDARTVSICPPGRLDPLSVEATVSEWRTLGDGRQAALVHFPNNDPNWLVFENENAPDSQTVGPVRVRYQRKEE